MTTDGRASFRDVAYASARQRGDLFNLPVIEKEIVHYEILKSLYRNGHFEHMTFQGGTCLRLCYGSPRYSEDLDFACGSGFDEIDALAVTDDLSRDLLHSYDVDVRIREPRRAKEFEGVSVRRWVVSVDTAPERPDLPSQKIKIEMASCPAYERDPRSLRVNYSLLPDSYAGVIVPCQSLSEIAADKLVSFANTEGYVRHRDIWDLGWIAEREPLDASRLARLVEKKHADYGCATAVGELLARGAELAADTSDSDEFSNQMRRFLPADLYGRTFADDASARDLGSRVSRIYQKVADALADRSLASAAQRASEKAARTRKGRGLGAR